MALLAQALWVLGQEAFLHSWPDEQKQPPEDGNLSVPASAPEKEEEFQEPSNTSFAEFNLVAQGSL